MHSYQGKTATFHFDGGLEGGDLIIIDKNTEQKIRISADDVIDLVAYEYVMPKKIREIEQSEPDELLFGKDEKLVKKIAKIDSMLQEGITYADMYNPDDEINPHSR